MHAVVVGELPVVETLLAQLLGGNNLGYGAAQRVDDAALLGGRHLQPLGHVAALQILCGLGVDSVCQSLTGEAVLRDVAAPGYGVAVGNGVVDDLHHLVHRHVVRQREAPVVLHLYGKGRIEWVMGIAGDADVVVEVDLQRFHERFRSILLALIGELLRTFAQIGVEDALHADLPLVADFLGTALRNGSHIGLEQ